MYCKNCGKIISDNSRFCQHCGTSLDQRTSEHFSSNFPFSASSYAVFSFVFTVILLFPAWLTVNLPTALQTIGLSTSYAYSPLFLMELLDKIAQLTQIPDDSVALFFNLVAALSWIIIVMILFHLAIMIENIYHNKKTKYLEGEFISLLCIVSSIAFIVAVAFLNNNVTEMTNNFEIIKFSPTVCPFIILVLNAIAFIWLIIEERNQSEKYDDENTDEND